jgi:heme exporter protein CcmD
MPHAPFIIAAFAVTGVAMLWLIVSTYLYMRRAEASADAFKERS